MNISRCKKFYETINYFQIFDSCIKPDNQIQIDLYLNRNRIDIQNNWMSKHWGYLYFL